jgi:hypothetical protein
MLTILGPRLRSSRYCDGLSRRDFLRIGALGVGAGALTLADVLRADAASSSPRRHKAVINIFLAGGPPHQDMWDLKTEAPADIRGEFQPIATKVPGLQICEVFPKIAAQMDRYAVIRSVVDNGPGHDGIMCLTGWPKGSLSGIGGHPSIGAVLSKLKGSGDPSSPAFVGLAAPTKHLQWSDAGQAGFLGLSHTAFCPAGPNAGMKLEGVTLDRLRDRRALLASFDRLRQQRDASSEEPSKDAFYSLAFDILTSSKLVDALDLSKEDPKIVARYGDGKPYQYQFDGAPTSNDHLLIARRLIEAGVRTVTLSFGRWDSHFDNFNTVRDHGGKLDQALSALVEDLEQRGMLDDVSIVVWGEFGRTPRINKRAGRDHWPAVSCALLAGGAIKAGQVIGSTTRLGDAAQDRPVRSPEVLATLYHNVGIDASSTFISDLSGRPQRILEAEPIHELL